MRYIIVYDTNTLDNSLSGMVITGALGLLIIAGIWMIHIVAPNCWRWLSPEEVDYVQSLLFSGALSATITLLGARLLNKH